MKHPTGQSNRDRSRCWYCGISELQATLYMDHVVPRCNGGTGAPSNLVPVCWRCNCSKGGGSVEEFRKRVAIHSGAWAKFSPYQKVFLARHGFEVPPYSPALICFYGEAEVANWRWTEDGRKELVVPTAGRGGDD